MLIILEDLGKTGTVTKEFMISREQYYLDIIFNNFTPVQGQENFIILNN